MWLFRHFKYVPGTIYRDQGRFLRCNNGGGMNVNYQTSGHGAVYRSIVGIGASHLPCELLRVVEGCSRRMKPH